MMVQPMCPAAVFCPFWIFIILLILYLAFFVIWIWILIGCQWLGTGYGQKRSEYEKKDQLIHLLGGHIRITKGLILISWIFFIFSLILVIMVGHIFSSRRTPRQFNHRRLLNDFSIRPRSKLQFERIKLVGA